MENLGNVLDVTTEIFVVANPTPLVDVAIPNEKIVEEIFDVIFEIIGNPVVVGLESVSGNMEKPIVLSQKVSAHDKTEKAAKRSPREGT